MISRKRQAIQAIQIICTRVKIWVIWTLLRPQSQTIWIGLDLVIKDAVRWLGTWWGCICCRKMYNCYWYSSHCPDAVFSAQHVWETWQHGTFGHGNKGRPYMCKQLHIYLAQQWETHPIEMPRGTALWFCYFMCIYAADFFRLLVNELRSVISSRQMLIQPHLPATPSLRRQPDYHAELPGYWSKPDGMTRYAFFHSSFFCYGAYYPLAT